MSQLLLSIALLFIAPMLHQFSIKRDYVFSSLNGFVFVLIAVLVAAEILPSLISTTGPGVLLMLLVGLALPVVMEKLFHHTDIVHKSAVFLAIFALFIHTLADGAALGLHSAEHHLSLGVVLHRIPVGLFVWWVIRPQFGSLVALVMLAIIAVGTVLGYGFAERVLPHIETSTVAYFQAFVVGTLIHVLFHRPHEESECSSTNKAKQRAEGVGNLIGLLCAFYLLVDSEPHGHVEISWLKEVGDTLLYLSLETAPMLLLAFLFAGIIKALMPGSFVSWLTRGNPLRQASKGMAVGVPLPLCSCSVVPVYHSLIKKGVPKTAAVAFLIATPEIGIDAILISLPLLGGEMTVARLIGAALLAVIVALVVSKFSKKDEPHHHHHHEQDNTRLSLQQKITGGLHYSVHDLLDHIAPWIIVGLLVAAMLQPFIGDLQLSTIPSGLQVVLFAALGIPVYVCASSATPLVAIFLMSGVSPGAGLAFLLAGPATNVTTFGVLAKLHDRQTAMLLAISCFGTAITLGLLTNLALPNFQPLNLTGHHQDFGLLNWVSLFALLALFSYSIYRKGLRSFIGQLVPHQHLHDDHNHKGCSHHMH